MVAICLMRSASAHDVPEVTVSESGTTLFGSAVAGGDFDGDGFSDLAVGALTDEMFPIPQVWVFAGGASGLSVVPYVGFVVGSGPGDPPSLAAGDLDGDGRADLIVGVPTGSDCCGRVEIHVGTASGVDPGAEAILQGVDPGDRFGEAVAFAGDVNGDGFGDVVVGAIEAESPTGPPTTGAAYVFQGSAIGLDQSPMITLYGDAEFDHFGEWVSGAGDVNGDGYDDLLISAPDAHRFRGVVELYLGSSCGPQSTPSGAWRGAANPARLLGSIVGDVDGDGYADAVLRSQKTPASSAFLTFLRGSPAGLSPVPGRLDSAEDTALPAAAGDVNGDGFADVIVGAWSWNSSAGQAFVWLGSPDGLDPNARIALAGDPVGAEAGYSVAGIGDVDHDGFDEVATGARTGETSGIAAVGEGHCALRICAPGQVSPGSSIQVDVSDAFPGDPITIYAAAWQRPIGACLDPAGGLCTGLESPGVVGSGTADADGSATIQVTLPTAPAGSIRWLEAVVERPGPPILSADRSDAVSVRIGP